MHQIQLLKKYGLSVRGARGQHLLVDENIQRKIADAVKPRKGERILEIGPGLGAITEHLLHGGAEVVAVEQDERFIQILEGELGADFKRLKLVHADILKTDIKKFAKGEHSLSVVGNIPYYITSDILLHLIAHRKWIDSAFLTVQKEIADRFFAQPGSKEYGRLSLLVRFYTDPERLFEISRNCFSPRPEVDSTFLSFTFRRKLPDSFDERILFYLIQASFSERRKNILNAISDFLKKGTGSELLPSTTTASLPAPFLAKIEVENLLRSADIDPSARAETLLLKDFMKLAEEFQNRCHPRNL